MNLLLVYGDVLTFCRKCGNELVEGAKFCPKCGTAVDVTTRPIGRESHAKPRRKPMSLLTIALIAIIAVFVIVGLLSAVLLLGGWYPFGEVVGSGDLVTNQELISDFTAVDVSSGFNVEISESNSYRVRVTADDNVMEYVEIRKSGDTLVVGLRWGYSFRSVTLKAEITMPELRNLELSGGSQGKIEDFEVANSFSIELSG